MPQKAVTQKIDTSQLPYLAASVAVVFTLAIVVRLFFTSSSRLPRKYRWGKGKMNVTVKWGKEKFEVPLPPLDTPLSTFRNTLSDHIGLPANSFKIVYSGAVLKDNTAPLSAFRIKPGCTVAVLGTGESLPPLPGAETKPKPTEESTIARIRTEVSTLETSLSPQVNSFLAELSTDGGQASAETTHTRLAELILQVMLRLDAMAVEGWEEARKERRAAVKQAQEVLHKLDEGWKRLKGLGT